MRKVSNIFWIFLLVLIVSCNEEKDDALEQGAWRVSLDIGKDKEIPFLLTMNADTTMVFYNAEEKIDITDIAIDGDSITIAHPVFEGVFKGMFTSNSIKGDFIKPSLNRVVPFVMYSGNAPRFNVVNQPTASITGNWKTVFSPNNEEDRYIAKGIFSQTGSKVTGTFRTTTGDYRYLEGAIDNDSIKLSTFDGAHAFLFEAKVTDSTMNGVFYSGNHWKEPFVASRNEDYELPAANDLTFLNEGYDKFAFSFPDVEENMISLEDASFQDKVVIVQLMGTWCPNCLDETKYYTAYINENKPENVAFVSLAFEYATTEEKAFTAISKLKERVGVPYPILLAQYGSSSKKKAQEKLPMLNHVLSYPTTIFIDKKGTVRKIHTGFNGPATGDKYKDFVKEFESFVAELASE
jgi:thiol-disulfide isomerase/thioredoxin